MFNQIEDPQVAIIGLGYVGLPLAIEMGSRYPTLGFDINPVRIDQLSAHRDATLEVSEADFERAALLEFTSTAEDLVGCNTYIVTVPTPIDRTNQPDFGPLLDASRTIGQLIKPGDVVIYESTVYPGATEEVCIPEIERLSELTFNKDFFAGYSPERINPGDKEHRLANIMKITAGSTPAAAEYVNRLYASIIPAGTHPVSSIRTAEAAKVIENTQRDLNIALINELAMIFNQLGIDSEEVLVAAGTKWNFLPFRPGLVGGHCIGVDPYYLTHKAQATGYQPEVIMAGRRINDRMGDYIAGRVIQLMAGQSINPVGARVLVLGLAFKENCPDIRNTRVMDVITVLQSYRVTVDVYDPWVDPVEALHEYGLNMRQTLEANTYNAVVLAVAHDEFRRLGFEGIKCLVQTPHVIFDVKHVLPADQVQGRL